jgi:hypothetical protein
MKPRKYRFIAIAAASVIFPSPVSAFPITPHELKVNGGANIRTRRIGSAP